MLWLKASPPAPVRHPEAAPPVALAQPQAPRHRAAAPIEHEPAPVAEAPTVAATPAVAEAPRADTILSMAKRELGKIDQDLRKEYQPGRLSASVETALQRLARGIDQAHQAAPNKWYQAAKIEDITPPGDDERKIYKITTVAGTYCVRYKDKNRPGVDHGQANLGEPLMGACPHMF
jgi:hypothetical protein